MATIGARDALRVVELTEQVLAIVLLGACQAAELRLEHPVGRLHQTIRRWVPALTTDRRMDADIAAVLQLIRDGELSEEDAP